MSNWTVPKLFDGATIYCLGAGPSLAAVDPARLKNKPIVTCNSAAFWAAPLWGQSVHSLFYHGVSITAHEAACRRLHESGCALVTVDSAVERPWVRVLESRPGGGLCRDASALADGLNCGHGAINLAYHLGADRIVLLGYDMRICRGGRTHWDGAEVPYPGRYTSHFARAFRKIAADLAELGVSVLNATPRSALEAFPKISLADAFS